MCRPTLVLCLGLILIGSQVSVRAEVILTDLDDLSDQLGLDLNSLTFPEVQTFSQVQWGNNLAAIENSVSDQGDASASITGGFSNGGSFSGEASATAAIDALGVSASAVATDSSFFFNAASGFALFTDTITINDGTPGATGGTTFSFDITGSSTTAGDAGVAANLYVVQTLQEGTSYLDGVFAFDTGDFSFETGEYPIVFGESFDLTVIFGVTGQVVGGLLSGTGTAIGDYDQTVTLTGIAALDELGAPVTASIVRASTNSAVPEPSGIILLCAGALGLIGCRIRRRKLAA